MTGDYLKKLLEEKVLQYNCSRFIDDDPVQVPHAFSKKEDIEIAGFMAATLAWGQRKSIIAKTQELIQRMDHAPFDFISSATPADFRRFNGFVYRTFNSSDCIFFLWSLQNIYVRHGGIEKVFDEGYRRAGSIKDAMLHFRKIFFETKHQSRAEKHLPDAARNSACKRLNLFLRWMIRKDSFDVDFGIWKTIPASALYIPLDVHTARAARSLNLLCRRHDDWKAVEELTLALRKFDPADPVKYDYALFCLSRYENIKLNEL